jgi:hypothetical protein
MEIHVQQHSLTSSGLTFLEVQHPSREAPLFFVFDVELRAFLWVSPLTELLPVKELLEEMVELMNSDC